MVNNKNNEGFNAVFLENDTLYFFGFKELKNAARFSDLKDGIYIIPTNDVTAPMCFELRSHKSVDTVLIDYFITKGAINYHFAFAEDGRYYQSHITVHKNDVDFHSQFPEG